MASKVEFTPPKAYVIPEGKTAEDEFEEMATFRIKADGRLCMVELGEVAMPGYEDPADKGNEKDKETGDNETGGGPPQNLMDMAQGGMAGGGGIGYGS